MDRKVLNKSKAFSCRDLGIFLGRLSVISTVQYWEFLDIVQFRYLRWENDRHNP